MSGKPKFAKLRLPTSKRTKSASSSQISAFFSKSQKSENATESNDNSRDSGTSESISIHSNDSTTDQLFSMPEHPPKEHRSSPELDPKSHQFTPFEVVRPSKLRRVDLDSTSNPSTIKEFFSGQPNEHDFENPKRTVKKATNLARTKKPTTKSKTGAKKQPKIRNVLLKREQILSNFIAEQSIAEHVDPNEIQMALALSRSEVETCGIGGCDNDDSNGSANSVEVIRDKLEEFGYRIGRTYGGNLGGFGGSKGRGKWANKFTALTLRDPDRQQEKINKKIEQFLNSQYMHVSQFETTCTGHFAITSDILGDMKPQGRLLHSRHADYEDGTPDEFYVENICKPTRNKLGNLLKDYRCIPGRDKSPVRIVDVKSVEESVDCQMMGSSEENSIPTKDVSSQESVAVVSPKTEDPIENIDDIATNITNVAVASCSDRHSTVRNFVRETSPDLFDDDEDDLCTNSNSDDIVLAVTATSNELTNQSESAQQREPSTCVQASENDQCMDIVSLSSESNSNGIAICERYSSDDVRALNRSGIWNQDLNYTLNNLGNLNESKKSNTTNDGSEGNIIDLTQAIIGPDITTGVGDGLQRSSSISQKCRDFEKPDPERNCATDDELDSSKVIDLTQGEINMNDNNENLSQVSHDSLKLNENENLSQTSESKKSLTMNEHSQVNVECIEAGIQYDVLNQDHSPSPVSQKIVHFDEYDSDKNSAAGDDFESNNFIDLTQGEINMSDDNDEINDLQQTPRENENLSQTSEASVIILSDDEVNYSIKVAKGIDISPKTADESDEKDVSFGENDFHGNHSCASSAKSVHRNSSDTNLKSPMRDNINEDLLNYSLAHEIMSHSFQEEYERVEIAGPNFESTVGLTRMKTDDIVCLDLTDPTPPDQRALEMPSCSKAATTASFNLSPEMDKVAFDYRTLDTSTTSTADLHPNLDLSRKFNKTHSDSYLLPKSTTSSKTLKRFSSNKKFDQFIDEPDCGRNHNASIEEEDEFDRLVYRNVHQPSKQSKSPEGINKLLSDPIKSSKDAIEEMTMDDRVYLVKTENIKPKPDYYRMNSPTRLNELYKYGLKPLKRKQAIIMLEYIYNQTHPYLVDDEPNDEMEMEREDECNDGVVGEIREEKTTSSNKSNKYGLSDCCGSCLLLDDGLSAETVGEEYIFQTNTKSKIHTARLPLHIAWYNLVKSNKHVREAVLYYEPIDLQEIYTFLKDIGYRYDPKDIKRFFDCRSIIFQYDLNKDGANRHVRKTQKQRSKKTIK